MTMKTKTMLAKIRHSDSTRRRRRRLTHSRLRKLAGRYYVIPVFTHDRAGRMPVQLKEKHSTEPEQTADYR